MEEKLLSKKQVRALVSVSFSQIDRWERDAEYEHLGFPKRIKVNTRVFWVGSEIQDFLFRLIRSKRDTPN